MIKLDYHNQYQFSINSPRLSDNDKIINFALSALCIQAHQKGKTFPNFYIDNDEYKDYILYLMVDSTEDIHDININLQDIFDYFSIKRDGKNIIDFEVIIENINILNPIILSNFEFNNKVKFNNVIFSNTTKFSNLIFNSLINFNNISFNFKFYINNSFFNNGFLININNGRRLEINNCDFNSFILFSDSYIKVLIFNSCNFSSSLEFIKGNFKSKLEFNSSFINSKLIINSTFIDNLFFNNLLFNDYNSLLSIENSLECINTIKNINLIDTIISGKVYLHNIKVDSADFTKTIVNGGVLSIVNFNAKKIANRESALLLKQEAYKNNNTIDALRFYAEEMRLHRIDIKKSIIDTCKDNSINIFYKILELLKKVSEFISLYASFIFSNNGQNWLQALFMTLASTFITFFCFYIDVNNFSINDSFFEEFVYYIIPTNYNLLYDYISSKNDIKMFVKICGTSTYFLGKILFGYGTYHIIRSFKKFLRSS